MSIRKLILGDIHQTFRLISDTPRCQNGKEILHMLQKYRRRGMGKERAKIKWQKLKLAALGGETF